MSLKNVVALGAVVLVGIAFVGCGKSADKPAAGTQGKDKETGSKHAESWWCDEHGMPESICAQCDSKLVAAFKAKGDWCEKHDRPDSQCFICHPEKEAEFAKEYVAKYGKQPPKPTEAGEKEHKDAPAAKT